MWHRHVVVALFIRYTHTRSYINHHRGSPPIERENEKGEYNIQILFEKNGFEVRKTFKRTLLQEFTWRYDNIAAITYPHDDEIMCLCFK